MGDNLLLEVRGLKKYFPIVRGLWRKVAGYVKAVDGVSFAIREGETMGRVGLSVCGKTNTGWCILRAIDQTDVEVLFRNGNEVVDIAKLDEKELKGYRKSMQLIFQDPSRP